MLRKYKLTENELRGLLYDSHKLMALEYGGVDNWMWYGESISKYIEENCEDEHGELRKIAERSLSSFEEIK